MTDSLFFSLQLHLLCAPAPRPGEFFLERRFAEAFARSKGISLNFDILLENLRTWCSASGIERHGASLSFSGCHEGKDYRGTATRFRDELSILIHVKGEGRTRYRIPSLWSDYSWLVLYQEPFLGEWRSWPGAARYIDAMEKDRTTEREAREGFEWACRRKIISRVRLFRGNDLVSEYFTENRKQRAGVFPGSPRNS